MSSPTVPGRCPHCSSPLVEISLATEASTITMRSCSGCDRRWWCDDGDVVDLGHVLGAVGSRRR